ncbi:TraX family protein [Enterococcus mundtii]|uniref:TraX family protein n=1 Tax=Enterococcus mundtii TaxID=53346 RepID=UPI00115BD936
MESFTWNFSLYSSHTIIYLCSFNSIKSTYYCKLISIHYTYFANTPALLLAENSVLVLLIPLLYIAKNNRLAQCALISGYSLIFFFLQTTQWMMFFAIIPILLYNQKKGRVLKYFFYIFYPTHIAFLYLLSAFLYTK